MSYTVLGFFDSSDDAQAARNQLLNSNFDASRVDYSPHTSSGDYLEHDYEYKEDERSGNFWDWLFGLDDEEEKRRYSRMASRADVVTVYSDTKEEAERARDILDGVGALDPCEYDQYMSEYRKRTLNHDFDGDDYNKNLQVIKEEMQVGKETVETGNVRVRSRIIEKPVEETVRLRDERVYVKRNRVDRPVTEADFDGFYEGTIEMTETEERAVVDKTARVVEEIEIGKDVEVKDRVIKGKVRETEVDIVRDGDQLV